MSGFLKLEIAPTTVERAKNGDMRAHELVYRTYAGAVFTLARRLVRREDIAEELLQETFVEVIRKIDGFRNEAPIGAWIRMIAVNKCLMHLRSAWHRYSTPLESEDVPGENLPIGTCGYEQPQQAGIDLEAALHQLPALTRSVIWLHDVEGYTHREIGELMGKTESFSKSQLARAHVRLRGLLGELEEVESCMQASNSC